MLFTYSGSDSAENYFTIEVNVAVEFTDASVYVTRSIGCQRIHRCFKKKLKLSQTLSHCMNGLLNKSESLTVTIATCQQL